MKSRKNTYEKILALKEKNLKKNVLEKMKKISHSLFLHVKCTICIETSKFKH